MKTVTKIVVTASSALFPPCFLGQSRYDIRLTKVEALEEPVRGPAWALLNETYRNIEVRSVTRTVTQQTA